MTKKAFVAFAMGGRHGADPVEFGDHGDGHRFRQCRPADSEAGHLRYHRHQRWHHGPTTWLVSISGLGASRSPPMPCRPWHWDSSCMWADGRERSAAWDRSSWVSAFCSVGIGFMKDAFEPLEHSRRVQELSFRSAIDRSWRFCGDGDHDAVAEQFGGDCNCPVVGRRGAFGSDWHVALNIAIPFVLGSNIGTTITAQLAAIQTNVNAAPRLGARCSTSPGRHGPSFVHLGWFGTFVSAICPWTLGPTTIAMSIAVAHTAFARRRGGCRWPGCWSVSSFVWSANGPAMRRCGHHAGKASARHAGDRPGTVKREIVRMAKTAKALCASIAGIAENDARKLAAVRRSRTSSIVFSWRLRPTSLGPVEPASLRGGLHRIARASAHGQRSGAHRRSCGQYRQIAEHEMDPSSCSRNRRRPKPTG